MGDESQDNQEDIKRRAKEIKNKLNGGKNSVTIETDNRRIRYDLDGKAHHEKPLDKKIDTPHKVKYVRNVNPKNPTLSNWSKKGGVKPMSHEDLDIVEDYLKNKKKKDK
ncbi:hypothetical protein LS70_009680 [Helicobacter sp. MIT 11-5569]|nr:hypothetical protein LS70_009680 [Helicobacter sp. MIT 11-5569]